MRLEPVIGDDPRDILRGLRGALHGAGPALGLGMVHDLPAEVRAGTAVVVTTSGSTGVPKSVILSRDALTASAMATSARIGDGAWLLALPASYVAGMQVLVRSIVADREPAWLTGAFTPQTLLGRGAHDALDRSGHPRADLHLARARAALEAARRRRQDATVLAALRSFETILVGGQAHRRGDPGARGGCRRPRRAHLRIDRDERRLRLRRQSAAWRVGAHHRRRGAGRGADARGRVPRRQRRRPKPRSSATRAARAGTAPATPGSSKTASCACAGGIDNVIVSGGINVSLDRVERIVRTIPGLESRGRRRESPTSAGARHPSSSSPAARPCDAASPPSSKRRASRSPSRSARMRGRPGSCWSTISPPCRAASPIARRSAPRSPRCTDAAQAAACGPVSTTQKRLPSVSSRTTQSASSG